MSTDLNPRYSFDSLVIGAANQVAGSAARSVAESPGTSYNPLFIFGPSGLGKTHILMAVGNLAQRRADVSVSEYLTIDEFLEAYQVAMATGQIEAFRNRLAGVDVLLLDDVQFLAHRTDVQGELLKIVTAMLEANRQVVLTSDIAPGDIEGIDRRLISWFDGGLVVDVAPPDEGMRLEILLRRAEERGAEFAPGVMEAVASLRVSNVRELLGLLNRLAAFQAVSETPITPDAAKAMLDWELPEEETAMPAASTRVSEIIDDPFGEMMPMIDFPEEETVDEFADFLSDVSHTVQEQVDAWRSRLAATVMRWEPEGYRTVRLEEMMKSEEVIAPIEQIVGQFESDIKKLQVLQEAMREMAPDRAKNPVFYDPDRVADAEVLVQSAVRELGPLPGPSEAYSPKTFVQSECNRLAVTAVGTAVGDPGRRYNPLVFVGSPGVGKTHLLHIMGHGLGAQVKGPVACMSTQQLLDEVQQAGGGQKLEALRARLTRVEALLLDDLQLLVGRPDAQEEFFYLFNRLYEGGRQLAFTLNGLPREVSGLEERIVSRLDGGLVAVLSSPDRELRRTLIIRRLEEQYGAAEEDLVDYLAARPAGSVREVLGLVQRVLGAAEARGVEPSGGLARELIEGAMPVTEEGPRSIRTSGVSAAPAAILSTEKVVWRWPDPVERILEELA